MGSLLGRCLLPSKLTSLKNGQAHIVSAILGTLTFAAFTAMIAVVGSIWWGLCPAVPLILIWLFGLLLSITFTDETFCRHPEIRRDDAVSINSNNQCRFWLARDLVSCRQATASSVVGTQEQSSANSQPFRVTRPPPRQTAPGTQETWPSPSSAKEEPKMLPRASPLTNSPAEKMLIVTCDCGRRYKVREEHVGKTTTCRGCGRTLKIAIS
jgi:hypothetical protein